MELLDLHNKTTSYLREGEVLKDERTQRLEEIEEELSWERERIEELEGMLEKESLSRLTDLDYERAVLNDIVLQLGIEIDSQDEVSTVYSIQYTYSCKYMYMSGT